MEVFLGIDVGSVTTKVAALNTSLDLVAGCYLPTGGQPVTAVQQVLKEIKRDLPQDAAIAGVATTGSARSLAGVLVGADLVKNEITCQAVAALHHVPDVRTVVEIGGQDSKIIIVRNGIVTDFGMNTVCAAGTGSFLDHQAARLNMSVVELSRRALLSQSPTDIAGRCTVFAESDMVHKQQTGHRLDDIIYGLCRALVRNYLSDVGSGRAIEPPVVFQGGVAFNKGIIRALGEALETEITVPPHHELMGAIGAALLLREETAGAPSRFKGFGVSDVDYRTSSFECQACPSRCEIARVAAEEGVLAHWGGRCDMWEDNTSGREINL